MTTQPGVSEGDHRDLRKKEKVKYDEREDSSGLSSESSDSEGSLSDEVSGGESKKKKQEKLKNAEKPKKRVCLTCEKSFSSHSSYLVHQRSHVTMQFKCVICKTSAKNRQLYVNHMKRLHPEVDLFPCDYRGCQQSFKTRSLLKQHSKMHLKYMCRFCKQTFARKRNMHKHLSKFH